MYHTNYTLVTTLMQKTCLLSLSVTPTIILFNACRANVSLRPSYLVRRQISASYVITSHLFLNFPLKVPMTGRPGSVSPQAYTSLPRWTALARTTARVKPKANAPATNQAGMLCARTLRIANLGRRRFHNARESGSNPR